MRPSYHLIGIGGIGMSGIAKLLLRSGATVSGSDTKQSQATEELTGLGAKIFIGHNPTNINNSSIVIYSSAIKEDNPEIKEARRLNLPLVKRAEALAQLMQNKIVITVAGSHGKTTTTSLASYLLIEAGFCPTAAIGGILKNIETNVYSGTGDLFVAEADESDGSFLYYRPKYSIITNIDYEHLDYYKDFDNELKAFKEFLNRTEEGGCVFFCDDDKNLREVAKEYSRRKISFGLTESACIHAKNIKLCGLSSEFDCYAKGKFIGRFYLALGGTHNISNSLAIIALGMELGVDVETIKHVLCNYKGAKRRLENKFENNKYRVIDDYGHHPSEIKATLSAAKHLAHRRLIAVFQPHRYSRTYLLMDEFSKCFALADYIIVTDIYAASENPIQGINSEILCDKIRNNSGAGKEVVYLAKDNITEYLLGIIKDGDLIVTLGAGDITKISDELARKLKS